MPYCSGCGIEMSNNRTFCRKCNQKKRSLKHFLNWANSILDQLTEIESEEKDLATAS